MTADRASRSGAPVVACTLHALPQAAALIEQRGDAARRSDRAIRLPAIKRSAPPHWLIHILSLVSLTLLAAASAQAVASPANALQTASPPQQYPLAGADTEITTRVQSRLMVRRDIPFTDIDVWTTNGVVRFSGVLDSAAQLRQVVAVAKTVRGVRAVDASGLSTLDE